MATLADLEEDWAEDLTPITEREPKTPLQHSWANDGYVIQQGIIGDALIREYAREWWASNGSDGNASVDVLHPHTWRSPGGYPYATPYMDYPVLMDLVCDLRIAQVLEELVGEPMGVHLNLSGWVSTQRDWHRDQYLNEPGVGDFYAAVWIALDEVHPDAGPFEFIPGSHKAKPISQQKIRSALGEEGVGPDWPRASENILTPIFEGGIVQDARENGRIKKFMGNGGDALFWHGRLLHRGTKPNDSSIPRFSLIAHYSGINHRPDMPKAKQHNDAGWYFPLQGRQPTGYK